MNSFYSKGELQSLGLCSVGQDVYISRKASIYSPDKIKIGNNVRIDDFCILTGKIEIGSFVHIAAYSGLYGGDSGIYIDDFANLSSRVSVYALTDDYSGASMSNPMIPDKYKQVFSAPVHIGRHVIIGATSVVLPGVTIQEGCAFGSFSFINRSTDAWSIYTGIPCRKLKERKKALLECEKQFLEELNERILDV